MLSDKTTTLIPMDRDWLARELERGRSIGDIARQVGRHPATVGYWVNKYRLTLAHQAVRPRKGRDRRAMCSAQLVA